MSPEQHKLWRAVIRALNMIPNTSLEGHPTHRTTYDLVAAMEAEDARLKRERAVTNKYLGAKK